MSGQINRGSFFGDKIYDFSSINEFKNFVEIGSWNGEGSTKCFMDAILNRSDNACLYSIESNLYFYHQSKSFWHYLSDTGNEKKLNLLHGRIIEKEELMTIEEIKNHPRFNQNPWLEWLNKNIIEYETCKNILEKLPKEIDVLLLDGGEFSTYAEFGKLKQLAKVIMLDDTTTFKSEKIREELMEDNAWTTIFDNLHERNGIFISCRTEFVNILQK